MSQVNTFMELIEATFTRESERRQYFIYTERLSRTKLPVIFSFHHLADIFGMDASGLAAMCFHKDSFYRSFEIPKRSGGVRRIDAPLESLATLQRWIGENVIIHLPFDEESSTAYRKGCSIKDHASRHVGRRCLLKLDIKSFYPSIKARTLYSILISCGYNSSVAGTLAHLMSFRGHLPQGAPSSPSMSNVVMCEFDVNLRRYCAERGLIYSRYADDLVVSGEEITNADVSLISRLLNENGFEVNSEKTRIYDSNKVNGRFLTGLVVNQDGVRVPKKLRREVRSHVYFLSKYYLSDLNGKSENRIALLDPLLLDRAMGKLNFWHWVEPENTYPIWAINRLRELQQEIS